MGMDVFGIKPTSKVGEYFRNNVWFWHPLWEYCCFIDETLYDKVPEAHTNSGDGLDAANSRQLAFKLKEEIASGRTKEFVDEYEKARLSIPKEPCTYCDEKGERLWHQDNGQPYTKICNVCQGTKEVDSPDSYYPMTLENVKQFSEFLMYCGGFKIC